MTRVPARVTATVRACLGTTALALAVNPAVAGVGVDTSALNEAVTVEGVMAHLHEFQRIADESGGTRDASSVGDLRSIQYVGEAMSLAGYDVSVQLFPFEYYAELTPSEMQRISPVATTYDGDPDEGFRIATYSGNGEVTATAEAVDVVLPAAPDANTSTSACEAEDFADFTAGNIALVQRGSCSFYQKAFNAEQAGATGVIIFNEGQDGRQGTIGATLSIPGIGIPVVGTSYNIGVSLVETESVMRLKVDTINEIRVTGNVIADTPIGREDKTVVVGSHLDSVDEGPGINDNGSGSAAILEIALQMSELGMLDSEDTGVRNRVRFAWWGAEELGLLGSTYYVAKLSDEDLGDIVANLNFDMVASPNYVRFVYDGDGSAFDNPGPEGSAFIEWLFNDYFMEAGLASAPTDFSGRSDYGPFIEVGIPAGGLFTGAEGVKTEEEAGLYGGTAGEAYDACYHAACDDINNLSMQALDEMSDAAAYLVNVLAVNHLPQPAINPSGRSRMASQSDTGTRMDYRGNGLVR